MNVKYVWVAIMAALIMVSCGPRDRFVVEGDINDLGDRMVEMVYWDGAAFQRATTSAVSGRFELTGASEDWALVELSVPGSKPLATFVARNGDKISIKGDYNDRSALRIKGNKPSKAYAEWLAANDSLLSRGDIAGINRSVAEFVRANRESITSTMLLMTQFHIPGYELLADSLLRDISAEARPEALVRNIAVAIERQVSKDARSEVEAISVFTSRDSILRFHPSSHSVSLLVFSIDAKADSLRRTLSMLRGSYPLRRLQVLEISLEPDSNLWRQTIRTDSARWVQAWAPGSAASGAINRLAVPRLPFFIVADSTGRQLYRGTSISAAADSVDRRLINVN